MRTSDRLARALANPKLFARGFNRAVHTRFGTRTSNPAGIDVFDKDWDSLFVLDACRFDMFETRWDGEGSVSSVISKGSSTVEWLRANFDGRDLTDTVYVTANPQLERNREKWDISLHKTVNVWLEEGWDEETGTVLADTMTEAALDAVNQFPNKRIVVHYMQPHYPFVPADTTADKQHLRQLDGDGEGASGENIWGQMFTGEVDLSREDLWGIYTDNLEYVLDHVADLLEGLSGKTVVTSDHGNYVGERTSPIPIREYGHPRGLYDEPVAKVPWLVQEFGTRREITTEDSEDRLNDQDQEVVAERLRELGYRE
jgi:hypothetical protein